MIACCGSTHDTPFCPLCGRKLRRPHPLDGLLNYLRALERKCHTGVATMQREMAEPGASKDWRFPKWPTQIAAQTKAAEKWKSWGDCLEELLEQLDQL